MTTMLSITKDTEVTINITNKIIEVVVPTAVLLSSSVLRILESVVTFVQASVVVLSKRYSTTQHVYL